MHLPKKDKTSGAAKVTKVALIPSCYSTGYKPITANLGRLLRKCQHGHPFNIQKNCFYNFRGWMDEWKDIRVRMEGHRCEAVRLLWITQRLCSNNSSSPLIFSPDILTFLCNYLSHFITETFSLGWFSEVVVKRFCSTGWAGKWISQFPIVVHVSKGMNSTLVFIFLFIPLSSLMRISGRAWMDVWLDLDVMINKGKTPQ